MTPAQENKLRNALALLPRGEWEVWTSCSFRRKYQIPGASPLRGFFCLEIDMPKRCRQLAPRALFGVTPAGDGDEMAAIPCHLARRGLHVNWSLPAGAPVG